MEELTAFQRDLLFALADIGATSGADIRRELRKSIYPSLLPGRLYQNLDDLVDWGLVAKHTDAGRTNEYSLTGQGRRELRELYEWQGQCLDAAPVREPAPRQ